MGGTGTLIADSAAWLIFGIATRLSTLTDCSTNARDRMYICRYLRSMSERIGYMSALHRPANAARTTFASAGRIFVYRITPDAYRCLPLVTADSRMVRN